MIKTIIIIKRWGFFYFVNFYKAAAAYELETRKSSNLVRPGTVKYHDPVIIFALAVVDLLGPSLYTVIFVVAITEILIYARMTRTPA